MLGLRDLGINKYKIDHRLLHTVLSLFTSIQH